MKVLLLHAEDRFEDFAGICHWDLVVDLGRAPVSSYELWSRAAGCRVISLYQLGEEMEDLHRTRGLLQLGMRQIIDRFGIDWWDVLSLMLVSDLQQVMLVRRLAKDLRLGYEVYSSRPCLSVAALEALLGREVTNLESGSGPVTRRLRHYRDALRHLDGGQLAQIIQDRFDREHAIRRRLAGRMERSERPVVLLPSAYVNVSRTAVAYASTVPRQQFLLVLARNSGRLRNLPANVISRSLDPYFGAADREEIAGLAESWVKLKAHLATASDEFSVAGGVGILGQMPSLIRWGVAVRDAWVKLLKSENVVGCLCADDTNPYTRVPLILSTQRAIPTLVCHHGALDARMAIKTQYGDHYLAKGEMERDYLIRLCRVAPEKVVIGGQPLRQVRSEQTANQPDKAQWLVFFSEPYGASAWRSEEVYRDLLPRLVALARRCGLKLVFKLHPFESVKGHRRLLRQFLGKKEEREVKVIAGPPSLELWENIRFAMTVQSSVALECVNLGIPVFLCSWLRDAFNGYVSQYAKFGIGHELQSPEDLELLPQMLSQFEFRSDNREGLTTEINPAALSAMLVGHTPSQLAKTTPLKVS